MINIMGLEIMGSFDHINSATTMGIATVFHPIFATLAFLKTGAIINSTTAGRIPRNILLRVSLLFIMSGVRNIAINSIIANDGIMVKPMLYKGKTEVINPQIASKANIDSLQNAFVKVIIEGLGKPAQSEKIQVAGVSGGCQLSTEEDDSEGKMNTEYSVEYCGYFPAENPKYSIIVSMNKVGLPASGNLMAGSVFKEIVDCMTE